MSTASGAYRCAECKSWRNLMAWAVALVEGPLNERGGLVQYDYVDDCGVLEEDSIHCTRHIDAEIERFQGGRWCRWWSCPMCKGRGRVGENDIGGGYGCQGGIEWPARLLGYRARKMHGGWLPAREVAALRSAEEGKAARDGAGAGR